MEKTSGIGKLIIAIIFLVLAAFVVSNGKGEAVLAEETDVMINYEFKDLEGCNCALKEYDGKSKGIILFLSGEGGLFLNKAILEDYLLNVLKSFSGGSKKLSKEARTFYDAAKTECFVAISGDVLVFGVVEEEIIHVTGGEFVSREVMKIDRQMAEEMIFYMEKYLSEPSSD